MKFITSFFLFIIAFFAPVYPMLLAVGCAIAIDTIFGIYKVLKLKGRKSFSSKMARIGIVSKTITYALSVILVFVIDHNFLSELINDYFEIKVIYLPTKLIAGVFIFIEMVSTYENLNDILGYDLIERIKSMIGKSKEVKDDIKDFKN
jgi:hypothetical protein